MLTSSSSGLGVTRIVGVLRSVIAKYSEMDDVAAPDNTGLPILTRQGLSLLARPAAADDMRDLAEALIVDKSYYRQLLDVEFLTLEECLRSAQVLAKSDTSFVAGLIRSADLSGNAKSVMRALELVDGLNQARVAAQWIHRLTAAESDPNLRSKAVKILSTLHVNLSLIEKQLESSDPRVRANAVEGLWGESSHRHTQLLERAAKDPHHRVAANGLYGLYVAKVPGTVERMIHIANSASPQHRAAISWAMGRTGLRQFSSELDKLAADSDDGVRSAAARALLELQESCAGLTSAAVG